MMARMEDAPAQPMPIPEPAPAAWWRSLAVGAVLLAVYLSNGREIGTYDTEPAALLPYAILRGDGPFLDRFFPPESRRVRVELPAFVDRRRGHIVSRYPLGPALVALPIEAAFYAWYDRADPGWDHTPNVRYRGTGAATKFAAALIAAAAGVLIDRLLRRVGLGSVAWTAALAAGLGSNLWAVASQALWQHGPAALGLVTATLLLLPRPARRWRLFGAGLAAAVMVACRSIDVVFAATLTAWLALHQPRGLGWFLPGPLVIGGALLAYNLHYFGAIEGGQAALEAMHPELHGVQGVWTGDLVEGLLGTLVSPSRGLFVFTPWIALAVLCLPLYARRLRRWSLPAWMAASLVGYLLVLSKYSVWWGGHCFGPRYWTDAVPLLAVMLAFLLDEARARARVLIVLAALTIAWSVGIQALGAFRYPSDWNLRPENVDRHHERLWDWKDTEIVRCLLSAPRRRGS